MDRKALNVARRRLRSLVPVPVPLGLEPSTDVSPEGPGAFRLSGRSPRMRLRAPGALGLARLELSGTAERETAVVLRRADKDGEASLPLVRLAQERRTGAVHVIVDADTELELLFAPTQARVTLDTVRCVPVTPLKVAAGASRVLKERVRNPGPFASRFGDPRDVWDTARHRLLHPEVDLYALWREFNAPRADELAEMAAQSERFARRPLVSIVVPVFNPKLDELRACIASVQRQVYANWQLCLADDRSTHPEVRAELERQAAADGRIEVTFRQANGHISAASNSALALARGEFVALLDQDDALSPDALFEVVRAINSAPDVDVLYSDEDKLSPRGEHIDSRFKPRWSPDLLLSQMYIGHLTVYRRSLVDRVGGFREGYEGSQDHDLALRITELTTRVVHIPRVLYHWRIGAGSSAGDQGAKPYAIDSARRALADALGRRGEGGAVEPLAGFPGHYVVRYARPASRRVSVIIPTRDRPDLLRTALTSFVRTAPAEGWELCVVDNGSVEAGTLELFAHFQRLLGDRFKVVRVDEPFNFSRLINRGAHASAGELLLLLNNDTEALSRGWLDELGGWALRPSTGAVGCRLRYPDRVIQHAGVVISSARIGQHTLLGEPADSPGYYGQLTSSSNVSAVTGACLMVRRAVFDEVGGFDEALSVAYNDVDFCLKAEAAGYRNVLLGHVQLVHHESRSRGYDEEDAAKLGRLAAEAELMRARWGSELDRDVAQNPNLNPLTFEVRVQRTPRGELGAPIARRVDAAKAPLGMKQAAVR